MQMEFPGHPLFVSLLMLTLLLGVFLWPQEQGDSLSLSSQGNIITKKHIFGKGTALPNLVMWFMQPSAHWHTELPFMNKASLPAGGDPQRLDVLAVLQGGFWSVRLRRGTTLVVLCSSSKSFCCCAGSYLFLHLELGISALRGILS